MEGGAQTIAHMPQFIGSRRVSTHASRQRLRPGRHAHCPSLHENPSPQRTPQAPQFAGSFRVSMHLSTHCVLPGGHWHCPFMQV